MKEQKMNKIRKDFLKICDSDEIIEIDSIINRVNSFGLIVEVVFTALEEIKSNPNTSPLLALQIAAKDWDC
tara:strand:- start:889 stop:1101 length:213 start_codon:yes stop_codon:yes gene_type:complete